MATTSSSSLYDTFGNEIKYQMTQGKLAAYFENATIRFPLPEPSAEILKRLSTETVEPIDPTTLDAVRGELEAIGFGAPSALAMADILIRVARSQNVNVMEYFDFTAASLKMTVDAYATMNGLRPQGSRVGLVKPIANHVAPPAALIRP